MLDEEVGANEEGIAGERGEELVGRFAVADGPEGQDLPDAGAGGLEPFGEAEGLGAEVADTVGAGERCGV